MKLKLCKGCRTVILRKVLSGGKLEHKAHYQAKVYHDIHCKLIYSMSRPTSHHARRG